MLSHLQHTFDYLVHTTCFGNMLPILVFSYLVCFEISRCLQRQRTVLRSRERESSKQDEAKDMEWKPGWKGKGCPFLPPVEETLDLAPKSAVISLLGLVVGKGATCDHWVPPQPLHVLDLTLHYGAAPMSSFTIDKPVGGM